MDMDGKTGVKIGERWRRGGRRGGRRRVIKDSAGRFMECMAAGRIHNKMVGSKEVITWDRIGHLAEDKRKGKVVGGKGQSKVADSPCKHRGAAGSDELRARRRC